MTIINFKYFDLKVEKRVSLILAIKLTQKNPKAPQHLDFYPVPSFNIPLGSLIPQNVSGLIIAEKSISVSNVACRCQADRILYNTYNAYISLIAFSL